MLAREVLNDPEIAPRLTPEEQDLRAQIAEALTGSPPSAVSSSQARN
jgi:hypothetical protein